MNMNSAFATAVIKIQDHQENDHFQIPDKLEPIVIVAPSSKLIQSTAELGVYFEYNDPSSIDISEIFTDLSKFANTVGLDENLTANIMDLKNITQDEFQIVEKASEILRHGITFHYLSNAVAFLYVTAQNADLNKDDYANLLSSDEFQNLKSVRPVLADLMQIIFKPELSIQEIESSILDSFKD